MHNGYNIVNKSFILLITIILCFISGCTSPTYTEAEEFIRARSDEVTDLLSPAHVIVTDEAYIDNMPLFHEYYSDWAKSIVTVNAPKGTKLKELMAAIFKQRPEVRVVYQNGIDDNESIKEDVELEGKLADVLKEISKLVNYHYIIENKDVIWTPRITKLFQLGILPGRVEYGMGGQLKGAGSGANAVAAGKVEYKNELTDNVWGNLEEVLKELVSNQGKFTLGKNSSILTVIDRPNNIQAVADYVEKFNNYHLQQVGIKVQVLEVDLNDEYKRGIDWNLVQSKINGAAFGVDVNLSSNVSPLATISTGSVSEGSTAASGTSPGANLIYSKISGPWKGSNGIVQFIEQQGNVSLISEPRFTVLNNQVAEIKIIDTEGYLKSIKTTTTNNILGSTQTQLEQDQLTTGFSLYIVPTIFEKEVLLQITTSISRKIGITSITADGNNSGNRIQAPNFTDRRFTQRSVVPNNHTLVLTGFRGLKNATGDSTPFKMDIAGTKSATNETDEIVILVTPVIIRG